MLARTTVTTALFLLILGLPGARLRAQDGPPPEERAVQEAEPEPSPSRESPSEESVKPDSAQHPAEDPSQDPPESDSPPDDPPGDEKTEAQRELTPEQKAEEEKRRRKREERQAKREARKEREKEKTEAKLAKGRGKYEERLAALLEKGYASLEAEQYEKAQQAFEARLALEGSTDFQARMGLARTLAAMDDPVAAIEHSLRAARDADRDEEKAEALVFAGDLTLRSIPRDETTNAPLPGSELYVTTARRYYIQAVRSAPEGAEEALQRLEEIFPTPPDERTERLYGRFLELAPSGAAEHARYLAAAYEALISGSSKAPVAVAGGISAPSKRRGPKPPYPRPLTGKPPRRILASLIIEPDGSVSRARILNGIDARHDVAAVEALSTWTFEPARLPDGTPVPVHYLAGMSPILTDPLPPLETEEEGEGASEDAGDEDETEPDQ